MNGRNLLASGLATALVISLFCPEGASEEPRGLALATDQVDSSAQDAARVAREVLKLQEELGGSIVTDFAETEPTPTTHKNTTEAHPYHGGATQLQPTSSQPTPVDVVRQTVWQMEQLAHRLEMLDLYDQSDAVRATASRLRQDARQMKSRRNPAD